MYNIYIKKRYPGNRFEYLLFITFKIEDIKTNEDRKKDLLFLFKKGNQVIQNKIGAGPLFDINNMPNQWFWSKATIKILQNNTSLSNDHLTNIICYLPPMHYHASLYCDFDTTNEKTYKIFTFGDCKMYKDLVENNTTQNKQLIEDMPYKSYYICKLPPSKKIKIIAETEFNKPYIIKSEYDIDAQQEIKEIILFDIIDKTYLNMNKEQQFIYTNQSINKQNVTNTYPLMTNLSAKFRRPHIVPILPPFKDNKDLYNILDIDQNLFLSYFKRLSDEDNLSFITEDFNENIVIGFSIIGSSPYCIKFLDNAFSNLRRNLSLYSFNDKEFILNIITLIINKLSQISNINNYYNKH